jgi:hypothetical protein
MSIECIHGVPTQQCAACRVCSHGLTTSRCRRCRDAQAKKPSPEAQPPEVYGDYEIFFVPSDNSWYVRGRGEDAGVFPASYRSAFQARRAVKAGLSAPVRAAAPASARKKRKK